RNRRIDELHRAGGSGRPVRGAVRVFVSYGAASAIGIQRGTKFEPRHRFAVRDERAPLARPTEIANELCGHAEREVESADPGTRLGEQALERNEVRETREAIDDERIAAPLREGHRDR